ncbi:MAG: hypothetical protein Tsb0010_14580 [Parvularculaceae bacterium]
MPDFLDDFLASIPSPFPGAVTGWLESYGIEPWVAAALALSFAPLILSAIFGYALTFVHILSLRRREKAFAGIKLNTFARNTHTDGVDCGLVAGSVVISPGAFRRILVTIRLIIGGHVGVYSAMLRRARREAVLRMKALAAEQNATIVNGVRFHTATIVGGDRGPMRGLEVTVFGSAIRNDGARASTGRERN